jgi:hypothetical protein
MLGLCLEAAVPIAQAGWVKAESTIQKSVSKRLKQHSDMQRGVFGS